MGTFSSSLADLPLKIESHGLEPHRLEMGRGFSRATTVVRLRGSGEEGRGEDVAWGDEDQASLQRHGGELPLAGAHTLATFSQRLEEIELFATPPTWDAYRDYRRWAFESAALDLALRQGRTTLGELIDRRARPIRFVSSMGLGHPPTSGPLRYRLGAYPTLRFKLDASEDWDDALVAELAALDVIDVIDFKGHYTGTVVETPPDAALYRRVAEAFPEAILEDPFLDQHTDEALAPHRDRISWDAPIHSVEDIEALPFAPHLINIKPSRFGSLRRLFSAYDYCERSGIRMYGGGQSELAVGRGQAQHLASLFHPDAPNDIAPTEYNLEKLPLELPTSPLPPPGAEPGFR